MKQGLFIQRRNFIQYFLGKTLLLSSCFFGGQAFASSPIQTVPFEPGVSISGLVGNISSGMADVLAPVFGQPTSFFFLDPQAFYHSSDEYSGSLGMGMRNLTESLGILDAYLFADYNHSPSGHGFWFISPGIQRLGRQIDFDANLYLPIGSQRVDTGTVFADEVGNFDSVTFQGHDQIDQLVNVFESVGSGVDAEIGYRLPFFSNNSKLYVGGYYFAPKDNSSITGGVASISVPISRHLNITASEAYDNVNHNIVKAGLTLSFGGRSSGFTVHDDLSQRLVDPIHRNLAAIGGGSHTSQPIEQGEDFTGEFAVEQTNIWFFEPGGSTFNSNADIFTQCTAAAPCDTTSFNPSVNQDINTASPEANMYLAPGDYEDLQGQMTIYDGESINGRSDDFTRPAQGDDRPILFGALLLQDNSQLFNLKLFSDGVQSVAVVLEDDAHVWMSNIVIGGSADSNGAINDSYTYTTGILLGNNDALFIYNSEINVYTDQVLKDVVAGIKINGTSNNIVDVYNSSISAIVGSDGVADAAAIFVGNDASEAVAANNVLNLSNDSLNAINNAEDGDFSYGVFLGNYSFSTGIPGGQVTNNVINICKTQFWSLGQEAYGVFLGNTTVSSGEVTDNDLSVQFSQITAENNLAVTPSSPAAFGIFLGNAFHGSGSVAANTVNLSFSGIDVTNNDDGGFASGIVVGSDPSFNPVGSVLNNSIFLFHNKINANSASQLSLVTGIQVGGDNNQLNLQFNTITADTSGDGSPAVGLDVVGNNNSINSFADSFSVTTSAQAFANFSFPNAYGIYNAGDNNSFIINHDFISAISAADLTGAFGVANYGDNNLFILSNNTINSSASGDDAVAFGIYSLFADNVTITSTNDSIHSSTSGVNANAFAVDIVASTNMHVTLTKDQLSATSTGANSDAYGVASGINIFTQDSFFTLVDDSINATSTQGSAFGIFGLHPGLSNNTWDLSEEPLSLISVSAPVKQCKISFDGGCTNS